MKFRADTGFLFTVFLLGLTLAVCTSDPGVVEGTVTVLETGQPLGGVRVRLERPRQALADLGFQEAAETGKDGSFRFSGVLPGTYYVTANIPPRRPDLLPDLVRVPENHRVTVVAGGSTRKVWVRMSRGTLLEAKVVLAGELKPLPNAEVSSCDLTVHTDANGVALLRVPAGSNPISAKKNGRLQGMMPRVEPGKVNHVRFELPPPQTIAGTVRNPDGGPAVGVLVSFHPGLHPFVPYYAETTTDQSGRYEIIIADAPVDGWWVGIFFPTNAILARDLERNLVAIQEFADIPTNLDLRLQPGITLSGSVKDAKGAPVTNATVDFRMEETSLSKERGRPVTRVNAQGSFTVPAMPQGRPYSLSNAITARGYAPARGFVKAEDTRADHYEFSPIVLEQNHR